MVSKFMNLDEVAAQLQLGKELQTGLALHWDLAAAARKPGPIDFLDPAEIRRCCAYARLQPEIAEQLIEIARWVARDAALEALAWNLHWSLVSGVDGVEFGHWPEDLPIPQGRAGAWYLLVSLSIVPAVIAKHEELGIPAEVTRDTCLQLQAFCGNHCIAKGESGILTPQLGWLRLYPAGELYRIGRFEYRLCKPSFGVRAFRHRQRGEIVVIMPPGCHFSKEGFVVQADDPAATWESALREDDAAVYGMVASPSGAALRGERRLEKVQWEEVLGPRDVVVDLHIPAGGGMTPAACIDSFSRAFPFFERHFSSPGASAIYCHSWIFNTQLEARLPDSNLARLMRELYLFPVPSSGEDGLFFIYCRHYEDWQRAPRETRLQRAVLDIIAAGKPLRSGGMLLFRDHLAHFGQQYYRRRAVFTA